MITETIKILSKSPCPGGFFHIRLATTQIASLAQPGHSVIWGEDRYFIMRANAKSGWVELLIDKEAPTADQLQGPSGQVIQWTEKSPTRLLIADSAHLSSLIFLADHLRKYNEKIDLVLIQADKPLPFRPAPCSTMIPNIPNGVIATLPLLSDWGITVRIASHNDLPGCFDGDVQQLATLWLADKTNVEVLRLT